MSVLDEICERTRGRVAERRGRIPEEQLQELAADRGEPRGFREALARPGLSVVAEFKRRSPSAGEIRPGSSVTDVVEAYERAGAAAISVLTEEDGFGGSLADLEAARGCTSLPILRKDFTVDRYQVAEAAAFGADAILLIVAALPDERLHEFDEAASGFGLDVLVEVHDAAELERALTVLSPDLIGINNRDLRDFSVDTGRTAELMADVPAGTTVVSESGIRSPGQVEELSLAGADAVLVGEQLMRAADPGAALVELAGGEVS